MRSVISKKDAPEYLRATVTVRPAYQDADPSGVVWHGNYFHFFDTARCALLDEIDYGYREMEESGHLWPIVDTRVRYLKSATFGQDYTVTAILREWEYRVKIDYIVRDEQGQSLVEAYTIQVAVDMQSGELCIGTPGPLLERLARHGIKVDV